MEIKNTIVRPDVSFDVIYRDMESESDLGDRKVQGVHAYCFYKDKLVVVYAALEIKAELEKDKDN